MLTLNYGTSPSQGKSFKSSNPCIPHFTPARWQAKVMASPTVAPWDSMCITPALNVSPAPRVSMSVGGGKDGEVWICPEESAAAAPLSPQAHMTTALKRNKQRMEQSKAKTNVYSPNARPVFIHLYPSLATSLNLTTTSCAVWYPMYSVKTYSLLMNKTSGRE